MTDPIGPTAHDLEARRPMDPAVKDGDISMAEAVERGIIEPPAADYDAAAAQAAEELEAADVAAFRELEQPDLEDRLANALAPDDLAGLDDLEDGEAEDALGEWSIENFDSATWAARKAHRARVKLDAITTLATDQISRIQAWAAGEATRLERDLAFFEGRLRGFHEHAIAEDPKAKTVKLPDGTELRSQAGKLAVSVVDMDALVAWAEANECAEELLRYPDPEPKKAELSKRFDGKAAQETDPGVYPAVDTATGEVIPGVEIERKARTFTISGPA